MNIELTPELLLMLTQIMAFIGGFMKLERRLTKLETTQSLMVSGLVQTGKVNRRQASQEIEKNGD